MLIANFYLQQKTSLNQPNESKLAHISQMRASNVEQIEACV